MNRSRRELSNAYSFAKFGFDTAADAALSRELRRHFLMEPRGLNCRVCGEAQRPRGAHYCNSASIDSLFTCLFVPLRCLQFLRIVRFTSQPANRDRGAHPCISTSQVPLFILLFVPFRYLQFLRIVQSTSQPAENEPLKVCQKLAKS